MEQTLFIIKPDAISRGLVGNIIERLEKVGLKMVACKMTNANQEVLERMYSKKNKEWVKLLGEKTIEILKEFGDMEIDYIKSLDSNVLGMEVVDKLHKYMKMGPIICIVLEGINAVSVARKLRGTTSPLTAAIGTIAGDLSHDSQVRTIEAERALMNLAHASGTREEAKEEIKLWFGENFKPINYKRTDSLYF